MSYKILYDDKIIYDPYSDEVIIDPKLSAESNAAHYFDFTISPLHPLHNSIEKRSGMVTVYSDNTKLFVGYISEIEEDFNGYKDVTCVGVLDYLGDTLVRPYSTISGEQELTAPSSFDGYFQWLIDQHNSHVLDSRKQFTVGVNQAGLLDKNNYIYRSSTQIPTTASEIENKILDYGGYLSIRYEGDTNVLDFYADTHESNTQIIDFGVNLIDFKRTSSTDKQYTAVRPMGATPQSTGSGEQQKPITISSLPDGGTSYPDITKIGDVVYSISGVQRYGYREYSYSNTDITTQTYLLDAACTQLQRLISPSLTLDIRAVDMALFVDGFEHLDIGQAVRVRSKPHNIDEYLMVTSIDLDLQDPGNTEYTLGVTYDTLTGQQSSYLKSLNSGINSALDSVVKIDQTAKDAAKDAGEALTVSSKSIIKTDEEYYNSVSPIELSGGEWQSKNVWEDSKYVWNRSLITYGDNTTKYSPSETGICISGNTGEQGVPGEIGPQGPRGPQGENGTDGKMLYAISSTESTISDKIAILSSGDIVLTDGLTVSVTFTNGNTAASPTLNINSTGAKPIYTNGVRFAYWTSGATVVFVYSSGNWYSASTPVYTNTVTIGNPVGNNVYIDSDSVDIKNGSITNSSFTNNEISLGIDNDSSKINMLKDGLVISTSSYEHEGINKTRSDIDIDSQIRILTGTDRDEHGFSYYNSITSTSDFDNTDSLLSQISLYAVGGSSQETLKDAGVNVYAYEHFAVGPDNESTAISGSGVTINGDEIIINNAPLKSFVFDAGIKNGWNYRKYSDSYVEMYRFETTSQIDITDPFGSMYIMNRSIDPRVYPFTFTSTPMEILNMTSIGAQSGNGFDTFLGRRETNTTTKSGRYVIYRPTRLEGLQVRLQYYVCGYIAE